MVIKAAVDGIEKITENTIKAQNGEETQNSTEEENGSDDGFEDPQ